MVPTIYVSVNVRNGVTIVSLQLADVAGALRGILLSRSVQFSSVQYDPFVIIIHTSNDNEPSSQFPGNIFMFTHRQQTKPTVCLCSQHQKVCRNFARKVSVIECINIESGLLTVLPPRTGAWPRSCWGCSPRAWWSGTWRTTTRPACR